MALLPKAGISIWRQAMNGQHRRELDDNIETYGYMVIAYDI